jgi:CRP-like cAMP-binding protein
MLSLSESVVNKYITQSSSFASNVISMLSDNIQLLMTNAEVWRLKTAQEKVGWYLNSININNLGKLTLSKSAISLFLGITPESFSRALNKLEKEGIKIENKQVKQSEDSSLCLYCDKAVGANCQHYGSNKCPLVFHN